MATTSPLDPMVEPTDPQVLHPASQVEPTPDQMLSMFTMSTTSAKHGHQICTNILLSSNALDNPPKYA